MTDQEVMDLVFEGVGRLQSAVEVAAERGIDVNLVVPSGDRVSPDRVYLTPGFSAEGCKRYTPEAAEAAGGESDAD